MSQKTVGAGYSAAIHIAPIVGSIIGTPILGLLVALIMWASKKNENGFIDHHGREAIRFQLMTIVYCLFGFSIIMFTPLILFALPAILFTLFIWLCYPIYMAIQAMDGRKETYAYTFSPRRKGD